MQLEELKSQLDANLHDGTLALNQNSVDSAAVAQFFKWVVGSDHLAVKGAQFALSQGRLPVTGTAGLLGVDNLAVGLAFTQSDSELVLTLDSTMPAAWSMSQGFAGVQDTFFGTLAFPGPALHLTASDRPNDPLRLKLIADAPDLGLLQAEVDILPSLQTFAFNCGIAPTLEFPGVAWLTVADVVVSIRLAGPTREVVGAIRGTVHAGSLALPIAIQLPAQEDTWQIKADFDNVPLPDLSALAQLLGGSEFESVLPAQVRTLGGFSLTGLEVLVNPAAKTISAISVDLASSASWPIAASSLAVKDLWLSVNVIDPAGQRHVQAGAGGTVQIGGVDIPLTLDYGADGTLRWSLENVRLSALLAQVLPRAALPAEVPDLDIASINCSVTPSSGAFSLTATDSLVWDLGLGGPATAAQMSLNVDRTSGADGPRTQFAIALAVNQIVVAPDLALQNLHFTFAHQGEAGDWSASGGVTALLFDSALTLSAAYDRTAQDTKLVLAAQFQPAVDLLDLGGGSLRISSLSIERDTAAAAAASWSVAAGVHLQVDNAFTLDGSLVLAGQAGGAGGVLLHPATAVVSMPLPSQPRSSMSLSFGDIAIQRQVAVSSGGASGWTCSATVDLAFQNLPGGLLRIFPVPASVQARFQADSHSIKLTVDRLLAPVDLQIPDVHITDTLTVALGKARLDVTNLSIVLGRDVQVAATIGVGLPSELNNLFGRKDDGTPAANVFATFDPSQPDATEIKVQLSASETAISLTPQSSFINAIKVVQVDGASWWECAMDNDGAFRIQAPVFTFSPTDSSFAAGGAVVISKEPLGIPLGPIKRMLGPAGASLPASVPIREVNLLDSDGKLNVAAAVSLLPAGAATDDFKKVLDVIADGVNRLPDNFKEYLDITIPKNLSFSISARPDGTLRLDVHADSQNPLKLMYPALALLPPWPALMPVIYGIQFRSLSFGPLANGSLFLLQLDAIVDQFDLVTLGTALLLPDDPALPLPRSHDLQRRFIFEKLFMVIVYETVIPIPIPVFYDRLGLEYLGLEGVGVQAHASFPMPAASLTQAAKLLTEIKRFFSDRGYLLPTDPGQAPKDLNLVFSLSQDYIETPQYLTRKTLGIAGDGPSIDAYQTVGTVLNYLKRLSLGELTFDEVLQLIPLDNRVGHEQFTFGPLSIAADWLLTTPSEFQQGAFRRLSAYHDLTTAPMGEFNSVIRLPAVADLSGANPPGLVTLLHGHASVDGVASLDATFGLAAAATQGFQTGFRLTGKIANALDTELAGHVALSLPDPRTSPLPAAAGAHQAAPAVAPTASFSASTALPRDTHALAFDGRSAFAEVAALNLRPLAFTVEWWLNPRSHHDWNQCLGATNSWGAFVFHTTETGAVYVGTDGPNRLTPNELRDGTVELNTWQHFAFSFDHGTACFYKNGVLLATKTGMANPAAWGGFRIGLPNTNTLDGLAADVRLWDRARSAAEIQEGLYANLTGDEAGLLGCWRCDDGAGAQAADRTGQNAAALHGTTWATPALVRLAGLQFDGQKGYVDVPDLKWQPVACTVEWWLNPRSHHDWNQCLGATNSWGAFVFHTTETGAVYVGTDGSTRLTPNELHDGTVELNTWQHFVFSFDHGTACFYKNGVLLATKTGMANPAAWGGFRIGLPNSNTLDGLVDEVRIWSRALSAQEVQVGRLSRLVGNEANLAAYWRFDQGAGATVLDYTSQHTASLVGATWAEPPTVDPIGLLFDGQAAYVDVPDLTWQPAAYTLEWWLNPRSHHDWNQCLGATRGWGAFLFHTTETGAVYVGTDGTTRLTPNEIGAGTVELNRWQHFAFTFDHGRACFYKNGALLATKTGMASPTAWGGFRIGLPNTNTLDGLVDEVRIWSRALSAQEIQTYKRRQRNGVEPGLYAYWRFGEVTSDSFTDLTASVLTTVLHGAHGLLPRIPDSLSKAVVQLDGYSRLSLLANPVFDGRIQVADDRFWLDGALTLFPAQSPVQVAGDLAGWISHGEFYLAGEIDARLAGLPLAGARAMLWNERILLSGTCLGTITTLDVRLQPSGLLVSGTIRPEVRVSADLGQIRDATHLLAQNVHLDLDVSATVDVTVGLAGFAGTVAATFQYNGKNLSVQPFTLATAPADLTALSDALRKQIQATAFELFRTLFADAGSWLRDIASGAIQWATDGYQEMGRVLKEVYGQSLTQTTGLLKDVDRTADDVGNVVYGVYTTRFDEVSKAMHDVGYTATQVGAPLKDVFKATVNDAATAFKGAGYSANEVGAALKDEYGATMDVVAGALKQAVYPADDVGRMLTQVYGTNADGAAWALRQAGYSADQVGLVLRDVFTGDAGVAGHALYYAGFTAEESMGVLRNRFNAGLDTLIPILRDTWSLSRNEVWSVLTNVGYSFVELMQQIGNFF